MWRSALLATGYVGYLHCLSAFDGTKRERSSRFACSFRGELHRYKQAHPVPWPYRPQLAVVLEMQLEVLRISCASVLVDEAHKKEANAGRDLHPCVPPAPTVNQHRALLDLACIIQRVVEVRSTSLKLRRVVQQNVKTEKEKEVRNKIKSK